MNTARQQRLFDQIMLQGFATPAELARMLETSAVTVRRELVRMEKAGRIRRVHGGAVPVGLQELGRHITQRARREPLAKRSIGTYAAGLVQSGETIFLDAGSTCLCIAESLPENRNLTVITHSLAVVTCLQRRKGIRLICVGGQLDEGLAAFLGQVTETSLQSFWADRAFIGAAGIHPVRGCVNDNLVEGRIKSLMQAHAQNVYIVADAGKFTSSAFCTILPIEQVDAVITDASLPRSIASQYRKRGITLHIVSSTGNQQVAGKKNHKARKTATERRR